MQIDKQRGAVITIVIVGLCWLAMLAGDWTFRMTRYQWHCSLFTFPVSGRLVSGAVSLAKTNNVEARTGGDLSKLLGIPELAARFAVQRPASVDYVDEYGFRNEPPVSGRDFPIVVVGDSYMNSGSHMDETFSGQLQTLSGLATYNHALAGQGPILAIDRFFDSPRFTNHPPAVLVWGLSEREIHTRVLAGSMVFELWVKEHPEDRTTVAFGSKSDSPRLKWRSLTPRVLHTRLPNTSVIAQLGRRVWNKLRYHVFRQTTPDVILSKGVVVDREMLFYGLSLDAMKWGDEARNISQVVWAIKYLSDFCDRRDIALVVVLIPDKAQVYREHLPDHLLAQGIPASCLWPIEEGLREEGVRVVNMLGPFREQAENDMLVYWPDDTHWNKEGVRMAVEATWYAVSDVFSSEGAGEDD